MGKFKPRELRSDATPEDLRRQLNEIQKELAQDLTALAATFPITPLQTSDYTARYGDIVRVAPLAAGLRVVLPPVNRAQPNGRVSVIVESAAGALSVEAVDATVNGADTVTYAPGEGLIEFRLTDTGWYGWSLALLEQPIPSDTFLGNVSGSSAVPVAVNLSSLAGADLTFSAHQFAVSSTWATVLGRGAHSGAHNPIVDGSQWLGFGSNPGGLGSGQIRADGALAIVGNDAVTITGVVGCGITTPGDVTLLSSGGNVVLASSSGRVTVPFGFVDFTAESASTPSVASGHGLIWTKSTSPSRLYFTDDANTDNKILLSGDSIGELASIASDTVVGNVGGSSAAPAAVSLSSLAGPGISFVSHQFTATPGQIARLDASLTPVYLFDFNSRVTDLSGNGLNLSVGTPAYAHLWGNMVGLMSGLLSRPSHDSAGTITGACSIEAILVIPPGQSLSTARIAQFSDPGATDETQANNILYSLGFSYTPSSGASSMNWLSEHSTGVNDSFTSTGTSLQLPMPGVPFYCVGARSSNIITLYLQGVQYGSASSALTAPDGGTTSVLNVNNNAAGGNIGILGLAIYNFALSSAQAKARYNATVGTFAGQI